MFCYSKHVQDVLLVNPIMCSIPDNNKITVKYEPDNVMYALNCVYNYNYHKQRSTILDTLILIVFAFLLSPNEKEGLVESILFSTKKDVIVNEEFLEKVTSWLKSTINLINWKMSDKMDSDVYLPLKTYKFEHYVTDHSSHPQQEKILAMIEQINERVNMFETTKYIEKFIVQNNESDSIKYYHRLEKEVVIDIEEYLILFRSGKFDELGKIYTIANHIALSSVIYKLNNDASDELGDEYESFKTYVSWAYKTLDGISKASILWNEYSSIKKDFENIKEDSDILHDIEKLKAFIKNKEEERRKKMNLFDDIDINVDFKPVIKPEIVEYINRYGPPKGGVFDAEKLAQIRVELNIPSEDDQESTCEEESNHESTSDKESTCEEESNHESTSDKESTCEEESNHESTSDKESTCEEESNHESTCHSNDLSVASLIIDSISSDCEHSIADSNSNKDIYYVYNTSSFDNFHKPNTFYYPLYKYEIPDSIKFEFLQHPGVSFWMPNHHHNRSVGTYLPPDSILEYIYYTNLSYFENGTLHLSMISTVDEVTKVEIESDMNMVFTWKQTQHYDWSKLFMFKSEALCFEEIYNKPIEYITNRNNWFNFNFTNSLCNRNNITIEEDYLRHVAKCLYGDGDLFILINNRSEFASKIREFDLQEHIQNRMKTINIPKHLVSQLTHDSGNGHDRLRALFELQNVVKSILCEGDNLVFTIQIKPFNDGKVEGFDKLITPKTYKIILELTI